MFISGFLFCFIFICTFLFRFLCHSNHKTSFIFHSFSSSLSFLCIVPILLISSFFFLIIFFVSILQFPIRCQPTSHAFPFFSCFSARFISLLTLVFILLIIFLFTTHNNLHITTTLFTFFVWYDPLLLTFLCLSLFLSLFLLFLYTITFFRRF